MDTYRNWGKIAFLSASPIPYFRKIHFARTKKEDEKSKRVDTLFSNRLNGVIFNCDKDDDYGGRWWWEKGCTYDGYFTKHTHTHIHRIIIMLLSTVTRHKSRKCCKSKLTIHRTQFPFVMPNIVSFSHFFRSAKKTIQPKPISHINSIHTRQWFVPFLQHLYKQFTFFHIYVWFDVWPKWWNFWIFVTSNSCKMNWFLFGLFITKEMHEPMQIPTHFLRLPSIYGLFHVNW